MLVRLARVLPLVAAAGSTSALAWTQAMIAAG